MPESYCRSCFRTLPSGITTCSSCRRGGRASTRLAVLSGAVGLALLLVGMLTLNLRLCLAAALVSACSAIAYLVLVLRSG